MPKTDNGGAASWRTADNKYREQQRNRRRANAQRRAEVAAAAEAGMSVDQWRNQEASK